MILTPLQGHDAFLWRPCDGGYRLAKEKAKGSVAQDMYQAAIIFVIVVESLGFS